MRPTLIAEVFDGPVRNGDGYVSRYWWGGELQLDGKAIILEMTMPGHTLSKEAAIEDARRIAQINNWQFEEAGELRWD